MDSDIIVNCDLRELYSIDIEDNFVAGVKEFQLAKNERAKVAKCRELSVANVDNYIYAGVMLMNLELIRFTCIEQEFVKEIGKGYMYQDQDVINKCCWGKIGKIPLKYNFLNRHIGLEDLLINTIYSLEEINETKNGKVIIHFPGKNKPWIYPKCKGGDIWWKYAELFLTEAEKQKYIAQVEPYRKKIEWERLLEACKGKNTIVIWGFSDIGKYVYTTLIKCGIKSIVAFCDNDENKKATLMEHLKCSIDYTLSHLGPHQLPLIGRADWNDCLNLNCFSKEPGESFQTCSNFESHKAESVFIAGMFVKYGKEYAALASFLNDKNEEKRVLKAVDEMVKSIEKSGWDGEWFIRAYDAFSNPVGSHVCEEGKIYIEPQGMCVMAEVGLDNHMAERALKSVEKYLDTKYGIVLLQPAYQTYHLNLGEVSSYPPGYKENAGIFCHNNPWISCAEAVLRKGDRAFEVYRKICPAYIEDISDIHRSEPYVYSQMIAGKDAPHFGEAKNSWLTGTAAWTFVNISQYILGIQPTLYGLKVDPVLPSHLTELEIRRLYRGVFYHIHMKRGNHYALKVNHQEVKGRVIPLLKDTQEVLVEVTYTDESKEDELCQK